VGFGWSDTVTPSTRDTQSTCCTDDDTIRSSQTHLVHVHPPPLLIGRRNPRIPRVLNSPTYGMVADLRRWPLQLRKQTVRQVLQRAQRDRAETARAHGSSSTGAHRHTNAYMSCPTQ